MAQGPIQVRAPGQSFEFTELGIVPLGASMAPGGNQSWGLAALAATASEATQPPPIAPVAAPPAASTVAAPIAQPKPLGGPRDVIRAARERVKVIRAELKTHEALKRELGELERLLKAAKQKPEPKVRALRAG